MEDPLTTLKVRDLRNLASTYDLKGRSKRTRKPDLVAFLREHLTVDQIEKAIGGKKPSRKSKTPSPKSETQLFDLPIELIWETLYNLPPRDALHFCSTHRKAGEICRNNDFWSQKIQRDFGELFDTSSIPTENRIETYKQYWSEAKRKLVSCAKKGHLECVESLLRIGVNPDQRWRGAIPLLVAAEQRYTDIVRLLLEHGANPDIMDSFGYTALITASDFGYTDMVRLLFRFDANLNVPRWTTLGETVLTLASKNGHADIVELLLAHGADPNRRNSHYESPLTLASKNGHTNIVRLLSPLTKK